MNKSTKTPPAPVKCVVAKWIEGAKAGRNRGKRKPHSMNHAAALKFMKDHAKL